MKGRVRYHIGVDSTDSATLGMCTTYLGAVLLERLDGLDIQQSPFPELVRLNPNVPWKTRGNGAVCLRYEGDQGAEEEILEVSIEVIEELSVLEDPQTNPGLVVMKGDLPTEIHGFYRRALHRIIDVQEAIRLGEDLGAIMKGWKNKRGLIGALASVGADLKDHTYEAMLYRPGDVKDRERSVDLGSLREASYMHPSTFFNLGEDGEPVCIPHSPCPVILGIRGVDPSDALETLKQVKASGSERWVLWKTNQHTDAHIEEAQGLGGLEPFSSITAEVSVTSPPEYVAGGHLIFGVRDGKGASSSCAAYEPTKGFRKRLSKLAPGDRIRIWGSVRTEDVPDTTINLEKVEVLEPTIVTAFRNPRCPDCEGPTASMGAGQGLRCKRCGNRDPRLVPEEYTIDREIEEGIIEPPPDAWRHLFKPASLPPFEEKPYHGPTWGLGPL
jgi:tRNA(Ile2)-agmatinylcytidine synthase